MPTLGSGLLRIPSAGGQPERLTAPDGAGAGYANVWPQVLPGARAVLFTLWGAAKLPGLGAVLLSHEDRKQIQVQPVDWSSRHVQPGYLLVSRPTGVMAMAFDPSHPQLARPQKFVVDEVMAQPSLSDSWFAVSDAGTLAYAPGIYSLSTPTWVDRNAAQSAGTSR